MVALSGGVDSAVAGLLSQRTGGAIAAFTLRLIDAPATAAGPGRCCAPTDLRDASRIAASLGLPHYQLDAREGFARDVIRPFVDSYLAGTTPIPCLACNDRVKFDRLVDEARSLGGERVVTGHYARIERDDDGGVRLLRARDRRKDQSYFLHGLSQEQLACVEFPLGELTKDEVRALAEEAGLGVANKPESQEICFVPDGDTAGFVEGEAERRGIELRPGPIVNGEGETIGEHPGVHRYTIGQRRGLGAHGRPTHVLEILPESATLVAGPAEELGAVGCVVERCHFIAGSAPAASFDAEVRVRHGHEPVPARVECRDEGLRIVFATPERAVAPGQAAVLHRGDEVLGGGPIRRVLRHDASED